MGEINVSFGRLRFSPPPAKMDLLVEAVALAGLVLTLAVIVYGTVSLPDLVPTHVGAYGRVDSYVDKWLFLTIFFVSSIGIYALLDVLNRYLFSFNRPMSGTDKNTPRLYHLGRGIVRWQKLITMWMLVAQAGLFILVLPQDPGKSILALFIVVPFMILIATVLSYYLLLVVKACIAGNIVR
ncbi:MAG TPA: DUF1648 domain-containing protein [Methanocella sp.]|nr:DUF1648 domain-containing protein [Methanocella sp.]